MNKHLTKKHGRPPPESLASGLREQKILLTGSQVACESEKSSWLARKRLASDIRKQFNQYKTENYEY